MNIGPRLRTLREERRLSQGDVEKRTGLLRCYVSRVENGHTIPSIETLEKYAKAFKVPLYLLLYEEDGPAPPLPETDDNVTPQEARYLLKLRRLIHAISERDRNLFFGLAKKLAKRTP
jgi:transcriptional regulator with XRE-family HTH domain